MMGTFIILIVIMASVVRTYVKTVYFIYLFIYLFIYIYLFIQCLFIFERDREQAGKKQRERDTQNWKQAPGSELSAQSPMWLKPKNHEIMT